MVDRDFAPHDAAHETHTITTDELSATLDALYKGIREADQPEEVPPKISQSEGRAILRCMRDPVDRLTTTYLDSIGRYDELSREERIHLYTVQETIGLPQDDEDVFVQRMDPKKMHWYISSELGHIETEGQKLRVLNDEFKLFTVEPYDLETYPHSLELRNYATVGPSTNPALIRLNALFPGLCKTLLDYGTENGTHRKSMKEFYSGLIDDSSKESLKASRHYLVLFALADSLLQRLVRPDDSHYQTLLVVRASIDASTENPDEQPIPLYNEVDDKLIGHEVAHRQLC